MLRCLLPPFRSYKIDEIDFDATPKDTFKNAQGADVSYMDYYKNQYGIDIRDPGQPMLINRVKTKSVSEEDTIKLILLVPEVTRKSKKFSYRNCLSRNILIRNTGKRLSDNTCLQSPTLYFFRQLCMMTGLTDTMRADFKIMKDVAAFTRVTPAQRQVAMASFFKRVSEDANARDILANWGLSIVPEPIRLDGRMLPPVTLNFGGRRSETQGPKGDWNRTATSVPALTPVDLNKWAAVFVERDAKVVQGFCGELQKQAKRMGINIKPPHVRACCKYFQIAQR